MHRSSGILFAAALVGTLTSCVTQKTNPDAVIVLPKPAFNQNCRFLVHVDSEGPVDLSSPTSVRAMKSRAAAAGGNVVVVPSEGPGMAGGDVYSCPNVPHPMWVTAEGRTPAFVRDQATIRHSCTLVLRDRPGFPPTMESLRAEAAKIGANTAILESSGPAGERTSFYDCSSLPNTAYDFRR